MLGHPAITGGSRRNRRAGITTADCRPGAGVFLRQQGGPGCAAFRDRGDWSIPAGAGVDLSAADVAADGGVQCPDRAAAGLLRPTLAVSGLDESIRGVISSRADHFTFRLGGGHFLSQMGGRGFGNTVVRMGVGFVSASGSWTDWNFKTGSRRAPPPGQRSNGATSVQAASLSVVTGSSSGALIDEEISLLGLQRNCGGF